MAALARLMPVILENKRVYPRTIEIFEICRWRYSSSGRNTDNGEGSKGRRPILSEKVIEEASDSMDDLVEPTNCCMRGCANCVWIRYAEKLSKRLADSNADIQKIIIEKVKDPNMKAFLSMELRCRKIC
ncbi:uncharacterized protein LOC107037303 [Diachasma alloeum]|uniref:uncharacterized protein LOC107037303 n=1 Tax=Diachasma alloeum TaxID=454923 RepID=UPI0007381AF0|nr:uncharacterized protein LOC107037303 [Diachasma alloeum]